MNENTQDFEARIEKVETLIDMACGKNRARKQRRKTFSMVCSIEKSDLVAYMISNGADVNEIDLYGMCTPLVAAAIEGNIETMKILLENGANINLHVLGYGTPIMAAVSENQIEAVQFLLEKKPNPQLDMYGRTDGKNIFDIAVENNFTTIQELILNTYPDINKKTEHEESFAQAHDDYTDEENTYEDEEERIFFKETEVCDALSFVVDLVTDTSDKICAVLDKSVEELDNFFEDESNS
ncbi:MAG: ankyrin repeat domain-containing protein [Treponemataceae bacterium]